MSAAAKTCGCGARHDELAWAKLRVVGFQRIENDEGRSELLELRNCACGNTLALPLVTLDDRAFELVTSGEDLARRARFSRDVGIGELAVAHWELCKLVRRLLQERGLPR